jgi:hypothetical protein
MLSWVQFWWSALRTWQRFAWLLRANGRSVADDHMSGKALKQFALRYGGETIGLF